MIMTPFKNGILEELFSCDVDGMDFPIGFSVQAKVKGLQVHYEPVDAPVEVSKRTGIQEKESEVMKRKKTQTPSQQSQHGISTSQIDSRQPSRQMSGFQQFTSTSMKAEESYLYESKVEIKTIDFGSVNIHQPKTLKFKIKNISGISTDFVFSMEKYEPIIHEDQFLEKQKLKEEELNRLQAATSTTNKRGKLNKTGNTLLQKTTSQKSKQNEKNEQIPLLLTEDFEEKNKFHSAMGEAFNQQNKLQKDQKFYLKNNLGLAIVCEPYRGKLLPKSEIVIKITCYNDSCGNFHDMLISRVKGLKTVKIPVSVKVTGSPLCVAPNQAGIFYKTIPPTINLGDLLVDAPSMQKILKLYNSGPQQIEVDWKLYNQTDINVLKEQYFNVEIIPTNYATMMVENKQIPLDVDLMEFKLNPVEPPESHEPYQINPSQGVVQGRSTQSFKISFTSPIEGEHKGVLVAYPRMKMENGQYQQLGEISVLIIAKTQSPKLTIDKVKHEDGEYHLQFEAYAYQSPPPLRQFSLVNETSSVLKFNMEITQGPFEITTTKVRKSSQNQKEDPDPYIDGSSLTDPNEKLNVIQTTQGVKKNVLVPGDSIIVKIKLKVPSINNFEEWPDLIRVQKDGILQISYPNGTNQKIILEGSLYRPRIKLFSEQVDEYGELKVQDFGVLNTTQYKIIKIFMENTTNVPANWQLNYVEYPQKSFFGHRTMTKKEIEDTQKIDDSSVFVFDQTSGILNGPTIPLRQTPQGPALPSKIKNDDILPICIKARFQPKQDKLYKSLYRITIEGGRNYDFVLRGYGSYKEEHDHIPLV